MRANSFSKPTTHSLEWFRTILATSVFVWHCSRIKNYTNRYSMFIPFILWSVKYLFMGRTRQPPSTSTRTSKTIAVDFVLVHFPLERFRIHIISRPIVVVVVVVVHLLVAQPLIGSAHINSVGLSGDWHMHKSMKAKHTHTRTQTADLTRNSPPFNYTSFVFWYFRRACMRNEDARHKQTTRTQMTELRIMSNSFRFP